MSPPPKPRRRIVRAGPETRGRVLRMLVAACGGCVSDRYLDRYCGVKTARFAIHELRARGVDIQRCEHTGYRLLDWERHVVHDAHEVPALEAAE